ncbi:hypothetical protein B0H17DRAFT_1149466 [Mycena rosella]|uniref:Uncharacterized protein n=1 Tax=Mycena rosella TaxID=1033263 RepID=A0AAD7C360_MYCRO|nr:hypothetical protein B0H17DRAFT_1149466 [Mycena rosella]
MHGCMDRTHLKRYKSHLLATGAALGDRIDGVANDPSGGNNDVVADAAVGVPPDISVEPQQESPPADGRRGYSRLAVMDGKTIDHKSLYAKVTSSTTKMVSFVKSTWTCVIYAVSSHTDVQSTHPERLLVMIKHTRTGILSILTVSLAYPSRESNGLSGNSSEDSPDSTHRRRNPEMDPVFAPHFLLLMVSRELKSAIPSEPARHIACRLSNGLVDVQLDGVWLKMSQFKIAMQNSGCAI